MSLIMSIKAKDFLSSFLGYVGYYKIGTKDNRGQIWGRDGNGFEVD